MMKIQKELIVGVVLGLIPLVILHFVLQYQPLSKAEQTVEQKNTMPVVSSPCKASIDDIRFIELQIEAVTIDMHRYLGWFPDEKEMLKKASVKAMHDLGSIKDYLQHLKFPDTLIELKQSSMTLTDMLIQIYGGIESKEQKDIKESFAELSVLYSRYSKKLDEAINEKPSVEKLPDHFDPIKEQVKFSQNPQDRRAYLNAVEFIEKKKFIRAYDILTLLKEQCHDAVFESCINFRLSECLLMAEPNDSGDGTFDPEKGIVLLSDILDRQKYSPVLFDTFYKWRTQTQFFWHGMSNMSYIPNWQYNLKRWQAVQTIRQYLKTKPDDVWANAQISLLLSLPNIARGGFFGNDTFCVLPKGLAGHEVGTI